MVCKELLNLKYLSQMKLIAGENGVMRTIRWIYFADSLDCTESPENPNEWIHGGELYVLTNKRMLDREDWVLQLMVAANNRNAAGFIINVGSIKSTYIELANKLEIPLFELPWSIRSVDLSQSVCTSLIEERIAESSLEQLLKQIIYGEYQIEESIIYQALMYKMDLKQFCQIAVFSIRENKTFAEKERVGFESAIYTWKQTFQKMIQDSFEAIGNVKIMSMVQGDEIVVLYPATKIDSQKLNKIVQSVQAKLKDLSSSLEVGIGVGNAYDRVSCLKDSYLEANKTMKLVGVLDSESKILFFKDIDIYSLLFSIDDEQKLEIYCNNIIGKLLEYDKLNNSELSQTLDIYLSNNCNGMQTANDLFIHRNTLRYRLDKVSEILEVKINDLKDCTKLIIAFHIKKYLEAIKR